MLGYVLVTERETSGPSPLAAPSDPAASSITDTGFSLSWTAVENAAGYEVEVLDGAGAAAGTVTVSGTGATVMGLAADTVYTVRVKALAASGSTDYADSDWSGAVEVRTALAGGLVRATLFAENFAGLNNGWTGNSYLADDEGTFAVDEEGWTGRKVARRRDCVSVGLQSTDGFAQTRTIALTNQLLSGTAAISFYAVTPTATASRKETTVRVYALDAETGATNWTQTVVAPKLANTDVIDITAEGVGAFVQADVSGLPEMFLLRFEPDADSEDRQFAIDAVVVSQTYLPLPALAAPAPVATNETTTSIEAVWPAVEGAAGYAVELRDAAGKRLVLDAAVAATNRVFTGLAWDSSFTVRVRALGDGASSANSIWSEPVACRTLVNAAAPDFAASEGAADAVEAMSEKTFAVSATRDGEPVPVSFSAFSPEPAVAGSDTFAGGVFRWTPTDDDAGKAFTATFSTDGGAYSTNIVFAVTARPPLAAPTISVGAVEARTAALSWDAQSRAVRYEVRLWRGTSDWTTDGVCFEDFFDFDRGMPSGWTGTGTDWYTSSQSQYVGARVKMEDTGDALVSRLHSQPVTNLSFHVYSTSTKATSSWQLLASTGGTDETDWISVSSATVSTGDNFRNFSATDNYRRFKWVFTKDAGNMGLGNIAARHAEAGPKFVAGFGSAAAPRDLGTATSIADAELRADTEYFLEVTAIGAAGETLTSKVRFRTLPASKATILVVR